MPLIHVYGYTTEKDKDKARVEISTRIGKAMNYPQFDEDSISNFKKILPLSNSKKDLYVSTFRLPFKVALGYVVN